MHPQNKKPTKIISDDRWSRIQHIDEDTDMYVSKFEKNEVLISLEMLQREWDSWSEADKLSFAMAYSFKPEILREDEMILDFLMRAGDERVWLIIAICLVRHSDKHKVKSFLLERLQSSSEPRINFIRALSLIGGSQVASELRRFHDRIHDEIHTSPKEKQRDLILEYMFSCSGLWKLENSRIFREEIGSFSNHADEIIRKTANLLLHGENPG